MALGEEVILASLQRRGSGLCVTIRKKLIARLGWNKSDTLRFDVIDGSLVLTKVAITPAPGLSRDKLKQG